MRVVKKTLKLHRDSYFKTHLSIVSAVLPVSPTGRELDILAAFLSRGNIINSETRKEVMEYLGISDSNLSNFMGRLVNKGLIKVALEGTTKVYSIHPVLIPDPNNQSYNFTIQHDEV